MRFSAMTRTGISRPCSPHSVITCRHVGESGEGILEMSTGVSAPCNDQDPIRPVFVRFQVPVMTLLATTLTCVLMSTLLYNVLDAVHTLCLIEVSSKELLETFRGFANKNHRPNTNAHSKDTDVHLLAAPMVFLSMFA
jgi:hypothetical protein